MDAAKKQRVVVGLSGGVDSSVAAALLIDEGYDVIGVFIKAWQPDFLPCTWKEDRQSAMQVAAHLQIPFHTVDLSAEYKRHVFDVMVEAYAIGETPNPDVACNEFIKFGFFLTHARSLQADYVATGHYAQLAELDGTQVIRMADDSEKDQSYFLAHIHKEALAHILFPIGHLKKSEVRRIAKDKGLPTHNRKDSQGLCFVGDLDMKDFLKRTLPHAPGTVLDQYGTAIGTHDGAALYTIGERHGFAVKTPSAARTPLYIISKDIDGNTITVAPDLDIANTRTVHVRAVTWYDTAAQTMSLQARYRYRQPLVPVTIDRVGEELSIMLPGGHDMPTPGQVLALYAGDLLVASGIIDRVTAAQ